MSCIIITSVQLRLLTIATVVSTTAVVSVDTCFSGQFSTDSESLSKIPATISVQSSADSNFSRC